MSCNLDPLYDQDMQEFLSSSSPRPLMTTVIEKMQEFRRQNLMEDFHCPLGLVEEDREYSGCLRSPTTSSPRTYRATPIGSRASSSVVMEDISIGKSSSPLESSKVFQQSEDCLDQFMRSLPDLVQQENMFGKKTPQFKEQDLNLESNPFQDVPPLNGIKSGNLLKEEILMRSPHRYVFKVIELSEQSMQTLRNQLEWSDSALYFGVKLELVSRGVLGMKQEWMLILKIPGPSFGAVTEVKKMLLSMNFEEVSMSRTSYDGWIDIQLLWKLKAGRMCMSPQRYGSPPI